MCRQAVTDGRIVLTSSGCAWRNFVPMSDVVRALRFAAADLPAGTYNLGAPVSMQLLSAAELVAGACGETIGTTPSVGVGRAAAGEQNVPLDFRIDSLAAAGFVPSTSFVEEVRKTLLAARRVFGQVLQQEQ